MSHALRMYVHTQGQHAHTHVRAHTHLSTCAAVGLFCGSHMSRCCISCSPSSPAFLTKFLRLLLTMEGNLKCWLMASVSPSAHTSWSRHMQQQRHTSVMLIMTAHPTHLCLRLRTHMDTRGTYGLSTTSVSATNGVVSFNQE